MQEINKEHSLFMDVVVLHAEHRAKQIACVFQTHAVDSATTMSYEELYKHVIDRAQLLLSRGYHNQTVALLYPVGMDFVVNFLACLKAGVIAVPLNLSRNAQQLERTLCIIDDAKVQTVLTTRNCKNTLIQQLLKIPSMVGRSLTWIDEFEAESRDVDFPDVVPEQLAFLQYTSGSTSDPKGVMVSHHNIVDNQNAIQKACDHTEGLIGGGWLPQFHDMGLIGHMLQPLYLGGTYVFMPPMNFIQRPRRWLELISHYRIHSSAAPNFGYDHCVKFITKREDLSGIDLTCWKVALNGSEPVSVQTMLEFSSKFEQYGFNRSAFFPSFGMAETTLFVSGGPKQSGMQLLNLDNDAFENGQVQLVEQGKQVVNCGLITTHLDIKIVNPETSVLCDNVEIGEIWITGASVAQGYWNKPEKTQDNFLAVLSEPDGNKYLRTGDMGFVLDGMLYVTGRIKEMIIIRGRNLYPYDIEHSFNNSPHAAGNNGASVFTIGNASQPNLAAMVEIKRSSLKRLDLNELKSDLRSLVMDQHNIAVDYLVIVKPGTIPKTTSGKVKRIACKDLIQTYLKNPA